MFVPALEENLKRERADNKRNEVRIYPPDLRELYEEYEKNKKEEEKPEESVVTIQIL